MLINIKHRSLKISVVEFVCNTESKGTELSSFLYTGVQEANRENDRSPLIVWLNFFKEVLVHLSVESSGKTGLETLWWLSCDLDRHLQKT
jgi:hypothetical protein